MNKSLVLIRFNLNYSFNKDVKDAAWHDGRFNTFKTTCLKSLNYQDNNQFSSSIFIDRDITPKYISDFFENNLDYVFKVKTGDDILNTIKKFKNNKYYITTRLDSDDMLPNNYFSEMFSKAESLYELDSFIYDKSDLIFTNFQKWKVNSYYGKTTAFCSCFSTNENINAFTHGHKQIKKTDIPVFKVAGIGGLASVHGRNSSTRVVGKDVKNLKKIKSLFNL